jgi:hypothetical protein
MAEEETEVEEVEETEEKPPVRTERRRPNPETAPTENKVDCPKCAVEVKESKLNDHLFHAHGQERRQAASTAPPPDKKEKKNGPPTPVNDDDPPPKKSKASWF